MIAPPTPPKTCIFKTWIIEETSQRRADTKIKIKKDKPNIDQLSFRGCRQFNICETELLKLPHHIDQSRPAASNHQADAFSMTRTIIKNILQVFCSRWKCNLDKCKLSSWRCYNCYLDVFFLFESVVSCGMSVPLITLACSAPLEEIGGKSLIAKTDKACGFPN